MSKASLLTISCIPAICGPGYHVALWLTQGRPPADLWYGAGHHFAPWHEEMASWVAINFITLVFSVVGAIWVFASMRRFRTKILGLLPIMLWIVLLGASFKLFGWALD